MHFSERFWKFSKTTSQKKPWLSGIPQRSFSCGKRNAQGLAWRIFVCDMPRSHMWYVSLQLVFLRSVMLGEEWEGGFNGLTCGTNSPKAILAAFSSTHKHFSELIVLAFSIMQRNTCCVGEREKYRSTVSQSDLQSDSQWQRNTEWQRHTELRCVKGDKHTSTPHTLIVWQWVRETYIVTVSKRETNTLAHIDKRLTYV